MNNKERILDPEEEQRVAIESEFLKRWTAIPGIIQSFNTEDMTASVQIAIQGEKTLEDGSTEFEDITMLEMVPVLFPQGGDFIMTFPIREGDECLLVFSNRCIDGWFINGGTAEPMDKRFYSLSDAICIPGIRSTPRVIEEISTENVELRTEDGIAKIFLTPEKVITFETENATVSIDNDGNINIQNEKDLTGTVNGNATLTVKGDATIDITGSASIKCREGTIEAQTDLQVKSSTMTAEAQTSVDLKCGATSIKMTAANVDINGGGLTVLP